LGESVITTVSVSSTSGVVDRVTVTMALARPDGIGHHPGSAT
jgi:hypothetical protein